MARSESFKTGRIHCRRPYSRNKLFACNRVADHTLPNGCAVATHSLGDWIGSAEGDPSSPWGRSPHLAEARSGFWKESVRPKGVGVLSAAR